MFLGFICFFEGIVFYAMLNFVRILFGFVFVSNNSVLNLDLFICFEKSSNCLSLYLCMF